MKIHLPNLKSKTGKLIKVLGFIAFAAIAVYILIDVNITPAVLSMAESRVRSIASDTISRSVQSSMQNVTYEDLITVSKDAQGRITLLQANAIRMNQLAADTALTVQQSIRSIDDQSVSVPLGAILGSPFLSGRGPKIPVRIIPTGSVETEFVTDFSTAGINQTRHEVYLKLTATMRIAIPSGAQPMEVTMQIPIAETVIVGTVPNQYANVETVDEMLQLIP